MAMPKKKTAAERRSELFSAEIARQRAVGEAGRAQEALEREKQARAAAEAVSQILVVRLERAYEALVGANLGHEALVAALAKRSRE